MSDNQYLPVIITLLFAITVFIMLGFVRSVPRDHEPRFEVLNNQLEADIIHELEAFNEILVLAKKEYSIESGSPTDIFFGIRNPGPGICFYTKFICTAVQSQEPCPDFDDWFTTLKSFYVGDKDMIALRATVLPEGYRETYKGELLVLTGRGPNCEVEFSNRTGEYVTQGGIPLTLMDTEEFFLVVR